MLYSIGRRKQMENRIVAIWARRSKAHQEASLESQVSEVKPWLEEQGFLVPQERIIAVTWTSLAVLDCPEMQTLLDWVARKEIAAIGMYHSDRLSGKPAEKLYIINFCRKYEVEILSKNSPLLEGREGELLEYIATYAKETQVIGTQQGSKRGLRDRARLRGLSPTMKGIYGMRWENGKLVPTGDYKHGQEIWNMALAGEKIKTIGRELFRQVVLSPTGKRTWPPSTIVNFLKNPACAARVAALRYEKVEPQQRRVQKRGKTSSRLKPEEGWVWLEGLVECPYVSWDQYLLVQERFKLNRLYALRNAHRFYLLRGIIECQLCHRHYYGVQRTGQTPAYVCSGSWGQTYGKKCEAKPLNCLTTETDIKSTVRRLLENPNTYLAEAKRRQELTEYTVASIEQKIDQLRREYQETISYEQKALRLLTPEAFTAEQALIKARRTWLTEEIERQEQKLANLHRLALNRQAIEVLRNNLKVNLDRATDQDWRKIFEALGLKVLAFGDGNYDIEVNIPSEVVQIETRTPWYISPCSHPGTHLFPRGYGRYCPPH
jgi:predicted site-specific integrase-resolvase